MSLFCIKTSDENWVLVIRAWTRRVSKADFVRAHESKSLAKVEESGNERSSITCLANPCLAIPLSWKKKDSSITVPSVKDFMVYVTITSREMEALCLWSFHIK
ncbi:hypothetical protein CFOL_v3_04318 [Cephalotus follicularis]|uniref:Uncharacterized protein n=1 Tax=Cephalotus follicularis TaxID=3775 RepID=A0A1Q3AYI8_CEPFO|nr:hypothetical protein CFOL_v3_04318 [Cephalotus follicularis]